MPGEPDEKESVLVAGILPGSHIVPSTMYVIDAPSEPGAEHAVTVTGMEGELA
jgi:hypothetical protein